MDRRNFLTHMLGAIAIFPLFSLFGRRQRLQTKIKYLDFQKTNKTLWKTNKTQPIKDWSFSSKCANGKCSR